MLVSVEGPAEMQGDMLKTIMQRRGIIVGTTETEGFVRVDAHVPLADMFGYATVLRSPRPARRSSPWSSRVLAGAVRRRREVAQGISGKARTGQVDWRYDTHDQERIRSQPGTDLREGLAADSGAAISASCSRGRAAARPAS